MEHALQRRLAAEVVGTAILVLFGAGSVVAALRLGGGELDYAGLGMVAIAFALAIGPAATSPRGARETSFQAKEE